MQWCTFKTNDKICEIEWKYDPYNVTMGQCEDFSGRVEFRVSLAFIDISYRRGCDRQTDRHLRIIL